MYHSRKPWKKIFRIFDNLMIDTFLGYQQQQGGYDQQQQQQWVQQQQQQVSVSWDKYHFFLCYTEQITRLRLNKLIASSAEHFDC